MNNNITNIEVGYELSINQMNLWQVCHKKPGEFYNQVTLGLKRKIDVGMLVESINEIMNTFEVLKFKMQKDIAFFPLQTLSNEVFQKSDVVQCESKESNIEKTIDQAIGTPYNPEKDKALRVALIKSETGKLYLVLRVFALWSDSYSMFFLCNELLKALNNLDRYKNKEKEVVEYQDFSAWQNQLFREPEEEGLNYWKNEQHIPNNKILDFLSNKSESFQPAKKMIKVFEGETFKKIKQNLGDKSETIQHVIFTSFCQYLSKFKKEDVITVGYSSNNRNYKELKNTLGLVSKYIPVTILNSEEPNFSSVRQALQKSETWYDYFYMDRTKLGFSDLSSEFFSYSYDYVSAKNVNEDNDFFSIENYNGVSDIFDMKLSVVEYTNRLEIELYYNKGKFNIEDIDLVIAQFTPYIINSNVEKGLCNFSRQIIRRCNTTNETFEEQNSIIKLFQNQVAKQENKVAVETSKGSLTYKELDILSSQLANYLVDDCKLEKGSPVCLLFENNEWFIISMLAVIKAGGYYVPIDVKYPRERIKFIIDDIDAQLLLTDIDAFVIGSVKVIRPTFKLINNHYVTAPGVEVTKDDLVYSIYTSGSTGNPKGCLITQKNLLNYIQWANNYYYQNENEGNWGLITSVSFDLTITALFSSLTRGKKIWIGDVNKPIETLLVDVFTNKEIDTVKLTPSHLSLLEDLDIETTTIRVLICGGEILSNEVVENVWNINSNIRVYNEYGPTETTVGCTVCRVEKGNKNIGIGTPIANTQIHIIDIDNKLCELGEYGEIVISGEGVSNGYHKRSDLNRKKFIESTQERQYKTGDIGRWLPSGSLELLGRLDDQVKLRGYRIELGEIEKQLINIPEIEKAVVLVHKEKLIGFVKNSGVISNEEIGHNLKSKLPVFMVPDLFINVSNFSLTVNGKLDKQSLINVLENTYEDKKTYVAPRNEIECKVQEIWSEILHINKISVYDDFFKLGGHSLKATQLVNKYNKEFGVQVKIKDIFSNKTLEGHATIISSLDPKNSFSIPLTNKQKDYPVSHGQERLWIHNQISDFKHVYNMPSEFWLDESYDLPIFKEAIHEVIKRHEILRTVFLVNEQGELRQKVIDDNAFEFTINEFDFSNKENSEELIKDYIQNDKIVPFNLEKGPLMRVALLKANEKVLLYYNIHHIIGDAVSIKNIFNEITLLSEKHQNKAVTLPELKIQYKDYATWQRSFFNSNTNSKNYWLNSLSGDLPLLDLPGAKKRPKIKTFEGKSLLTYLPVETTTSLKNFIEAESASLFIGLLASWNILLQKYTANNDIIIGTPVAGRNSYDLEDQIGFYVNTLALRNSVDKEQSFKSFFRQIKETTLASLEYQSYPFDLLIDDLKLTQHLDRSPLFDIMIIVQNVFEDEKNLQIQGDQILDRGNKVAKFDLDIIFKEVADQISFEITYNKNIFDDEFIRRMMQHFKELIQNVLINPDEKIKNIDYVTSKEKAIVLKEFNTTKVSYPKNKTILNLFEEQVLARPNSNAVFFKNTFYTYKELAVMSNKFANHLTNQYGVKKGDFVAVEVNRSEFFITAILGVLKCGAVYIPIDSAYPIERKKYIMENSNPTLIIKETDSTDLEGVKVLSYKDKLEFNKESNAFKVIDSCDEDLAYMIYTSGSTGKPKGVMIEHGGIKNTVLALKDLFRVNSNHNVLQFASFAFDASICEIFMGLCSGACLFIVEDENRSEPKLLENYIVRNTIQIAIIPPSYLKLMDMEKLKGLTTLITAGESAIKDKVESYLRFGDYFNAYGPTETSICATAFELKKGYGLSSNNVPIGRPIANTTVLILDEEDKILPIGIVGELCVGGDGLARGYYNNSTLTQEKFIQHPYIKEERLYKTGDLARWLPNGNIEFIGRKDNQIKINGHRIELEEIENVFLSHKAIKEVALLVRERKENDKDLTAYFVSNDDHTIAELTQFLRNLLPEYMIPNSFIQLENMPLTVNGKIDKKSLQKLNAPILSLSSGILYEAPANEIEEKIIEIIGKHVNRHVSDIGIKDNFYDLGANSIKMIRIVNEINTIFEKNIKVVGLFEHSNTYKLAKLIQQEEVDENIEDTQILDLATELDEIIDLM